jgi:hypothetical protein
MSSPAKQAPVQEDVTKDKLWVTFWLFTGISTLFVWNSVMSLTAYWTAQIQPGIQNVYGFYFMLGSFIGFFFFNPINKRLTYKTSVIIYPAIMTVIFIFNLIMGEFIENQSVKAVVFLILCFTQGFINNMVQLNQTRLMVGFGSKEGILYNAGTGIAGCGCSLLNFVLTFTPLSVTMQYCIYLALVVCLLVTMIMISTKWCNHYGCESDSDRIGSGTISAEENPNSLENMRKKVVLQLSLSSGDETLKQRWDALKVVYVGSSLMFWCFVVTLGVFPVLCFVTGTGLSPLHNFSAVTLIYNIGDLAGKFGVFVLPVKNDSTFYVYGWVRGAFLATFFGFMVAMKDNAFWGSSALSIILIVLLGATNGHFTTVNFGITPGKLGANARYGASCLVLALLFGLVYGSLVDALVMG